MTVRGGTRGVAPARPRALQDRDVAIRMIPLDLDEDGLAQAERRGLSADERRYAASGTPEVRRRRIALRAGLRRVLGEILDLPPALVPLRPTAGGRPQIDLAAGGLDVSCSAAGPLGLLAVARGLRIGIDVEPVRAWDDATLDEGWLSPTEAAQLATLPTSVRGTAAARCWTRKESMLKAVGIGLAMPPGTVDVGFVRERVADWSLVPVAVPDGYVATLASSVPIAGRARVLPSASMAEIDGMDR